MLPHSFFLFLYISRFSFPSLFCFLINFYLPFPFISHSLHLHFNFLFIFFIFIFCFIFLSFPFLFFCFHFFLISVSFPLTFRIVFPFNFFSFLPVSISNSFGYLHNCSCFLSFLFSTDGQSRSRVNVNETYFPIQNGNIFNIIPFQGLTCDADPCCLARV